MRKNVRKSSILPALSESEHVENLTRIQNKKQNEQMEKEDRKRKREQKKKERESLKKTKSIKNVLESASRNVSIESDDENLDKTPIYDNSSDDEVSDDGNSCSACGGNDDWNTGERWIGCNKCIRWFHKTCLSIDFDEMTATEIENFDFVCPNCEKKRRR